MKIAITITEVVITTVIVFDASDASSALDDAMRIVNNAPKSFTGDDTCKVICTESRDIRINGA